MFFFAFRSVSFDIVYLQNWNKQNFSHFYYIYCFSWLAEDNWCFLEQIVCLLFRFLHVFCSFLVSSTSSYYSSPLFSSLRRVLRNDAATEPRGRFSLFSLCFYYATHYFSLSNTSGHRLPTFRCPGCTRQPNGPLIGSSPHGKHTHWRCGLFSLSPLYFNQQNWKLIVF